MNIRIFFCLFCLCLEKVRVKINKVNLRKEFFCTIEKLENLVYELEPTASFNRTMLIEQYYQSMAVAHIPKNVFIHTNEDDII